MDEPAPEHVDMSAVDVFTRIVCGVDRSEASLEAVRQSLRLGSPSSRLILVAVSETRLAVHTGMRAPQVADNIEAHARGALEDARAVAPEGTTRLVHGRPEDMLLSAAEEEAATLIAVGSHGHGRGAGIVIGSVATRMLHDAPCSVLVARAPEDPGSFPRSIMAGVDGSPPSLRAASVATSLGERLDVPVTFFAPPAAVPTSTRIGSATAGSRSSPPTPSRFLPFWTRLRMRTSSSSAAVGSAGCARSAASASALPTVHAVQC